MDIKGWSNDVSDGNEELRNWRKGNPCYKVAKNLTDLCSRVLCKVEIMSDEIGYLAKELSKPRWRHIFLLLLRVKCRKREVKGLLTKKEPELKSLENSQLIHFAKNEEGILKRTLKVFLFIW